MLQVKLANTIWENISYWEWKFSSLHSCFRKHAIVYTGNNHLCVHTKCNRFLYYCLLLLNIKYLEIFSIHQFVPEVSNLCIAVLLYFWYRYVFCKNVFKENSWKRYSFFYTYIFPENFFQKQHFIFSSKKKALDICLNCVINRYKPPVNFGLKGVFYRWNPYVGHVWEDCWMAWRLYGPLIDSISITLLRAPDKNSMKPEPELLQLTSRIPWIHSRHYDHLFSFFLVVHFLLNNIHVYLFHSWLVFPV